MGQEDDDAMGFLKWLVWTLCAVSLGVWLGTGRVDGRTPLEHAQRAWNQHVSGAPLERMKDGLQDTWDGARAKAGPARDARPAPAPRERISEGDRAALNKLLAQQQEGSARR